MLQKLIQRLSDPVFYRRRFALLGQKFRSTQDAEPVSDSVPDWDSLAIVIAHPDDEVFCSGLICELIDRGKSVQVLCLTRGEGGPLPEGEARENLGRIREAEMRASCEILGITQLEFLDHIDPLATEFRMFAPAVSVADLADQISGAVADADAVLSHGSWGEYWHPAHLLTHSAVRRASAKTGTPMFTFRAHEPDPALPTLTNLRDPAALRLDFSRHHDRRLKALQCHDSQLGLFEEFSGKSVEEFVRSMAVESYAEVR
ncbi:MAG: PIG-L family deacetylase [Verrucomicrobiales bacterium]|nr:PIG-L family deacetylase [Verrucomicrobiales bacterium]